MRRANVKNAATIMLLVTLPGCASTLADSKALRPGNALNRSIIDAPVDATSANSPVVIAPEVLHGFNFLYQYVNETEFVLCLDGVRHKGRVYVTGFRLALITRTTINTVA